VKIALGADSAGYQLKNAVKQFLDHKNYPYNDFGTFKIDEGDYPEYTYKVANAVVKDGYDCGILISETGLGMCIGANKIKNIRAVIVNSIENAQISRLQFDANILCIPAGTMKEARAIDIVATWLSTSFEGGRFQLFLELMTKFTGF
jgi:ribose 5-phosphate isomerase B